MWDDLRLHWELFRYTWLSAVAIGVLLAQAGVIIVARDQIFLGAAMAQASTLGIATALALAGWLAAPPAWVESDVFAVSLAVAFSIAAALATGIGARSRRESHEAVTGWVFLFSASVSILLVAHSAHGLEEVHKLLFSSIITATPKETAALWLLAALGAIAIARWRDRLLLLTLDPVMAAAVGLRTRAWRMAIQVWLGLVIGVALETAGLLYTFGCLVLPPLIAKSLSREVGPLFILAPLIAINAVAAGLVFATAWDFPPAQMTVAILALLLPAGWLVGGRRRGRG